jgi:hypothetical protein
MHAARRPPLSRSVWLLLILIMLLGGWWLAVELTGRSGADLDSGGPLLPFPAATISELRVSSPTGAVALTQEPDGWWLSGRCVDLADSTRVTELLQSIAAEFTSAVLSGRVDTLLLRDYALLPEPLLSLHVRGAHGRMVDLSIGAINPVSGRQYALGAGRQGVFTISTSLIDRLRGLPDDVRLRRLWPRFAWTTAETLRLDHPAAGDVLLARNPAGHWWLREPSGGSLGLGRLVRDYDRYYGDRLRREGGTTWWRASDAALSTFIFMLGDTHVAGFGPAPADSAQLAAAGLSPPTAGAEIILADGQRWRAAFGQESEKGELTATRFGLPNILRVTGEIAPVMMGPLWQLMETGVLPFALAEADSFWLLRPDVPSLRVERRGEGWRVERVIATGPPAGPLEPVEESVAHRVGELIGDVVVYLDRLRIEEVRPPRPDQNPLTAGYRITLKAWLNGRPEAREVVFGLLPGGAGNGAWFPADGKWLIIPSDAVGTLRSLFAALGRMIPAGGVAG